MPRTYKEPKKTVAVSVNQKDVELVVEFCQRTGQDLSGLVDSYIQSIARTIRVVGLDKKKNLTRGDFVRLALAGLRESP